MSALANWYPGNRVVDFVVIVAAAVAVVSAAAWAVSLCLRRQPAVRHWVLLSGLLGACASPLLAAAFVSFKAPAAKPESAAAEQSAREVLAQFEKGDPGWKVRMEGLVRLVKTGPAIVPVLVEALNNGLPHSRDFAAQVLAAFAEPGTRPALARAVDDQDGGVSRIYAIKALNMFGRLEPKEKPFQQMLTNDPDWQVRRYLAWACERDDGPATAAAIRTALKDYDPAKIDTARLDELAPDFSLSDAFGETYRLSDFRGKKAVVLVFYDEGL